MRSEGIFDDLVALYAQASGSLMADLLPVALGLAGTLFAIQIAWDGAMWVLHDSERMFGKALRKGTIFLILYGLISIAPTWLPEILGGFEALGVRASGLAGLSPSAVLGQGLDLGFTFFNTWDRFLSALLPGIGPLRTLSMLIIIAAFGLVAIQLARVLIEAAIALGGLVFLLGFAGHRLSFGLAEGYLRYLLDLGLRIYVLFLLLAVGRNLGREWDEALSGLGLIDFRLHFSILLAAVLLALLVWHLPGDIASRIAGSFSLSGHNPLRDEG